MKHVIMLPVILLALIVFAPLTANAFDRGIEVSGQGENNNEGHPLVSGDLLNYGNLMPEESGDEFGNDNPRRATTTTYSMKVAISMPTGSTGAGLASTQPTNTKLTSCANTTLTDSVNVTLTYNAGATNALKEVYVIFYNPQSGYNGTISGALNNFYMAKKGNLTSMVTLVPSNYLNQLNAGSNANIYLKESLNPGGSISEVLLGGQIPLDGIQVGTWQIVGIVASNATIDFDKPSTWAAWDVGTFIVKRPWYGAANVTCDNIN